ncbi:sugar ABC transporter permease [Agromyces atrinae]|uniref:Multiple sugar transport system permease protein n=1 Tax=Agromyces atrinae TaxID=592376 RepID=A0A4Q2M8E0_9MICO|nr:sugar ABC transporter permease [Agromyces atrinae]MCI2957164.1 sugar ABC transporter permease [Agromyces atrinae]NYD67479.1 multiple sugar transport system permease protein [Agromyces atrinae]RXZ88298.1 sugar ABC transporter permease [Agromyces atrinae]
MTIAPERLRGSAPEGRAAQAASPTPRRRRNHRGRNAALVGFLFLLPSLLVFGYFAWWPIAQSIVLAFQQTNLVDPAEWVGLRNFEILFADPLLGRAALNTLWFTVLSLAIGLPVPLLCAVLMSELRRGGTLARVLAYLPVVVPPVVAVLLWKVFFNPGESGVVNSLLALVGLGPFPWLQSPELAMPSLVIVATWSGAGTAILIYLAALTGVSTELYEAAELDGASVWQRVLHITLPQMRGIILVLLLLQIIGAIQVFTEPYVMTDGGPANATVTILLMIYRYAFLFGNYGVATALSVLLALVLVLVSALYLRLTRSWSSR